MKTKSKRPVSLDKQVVRLRKHHKIVFYVLGIIGSVFIWRGVWLVIDVAPFFNNPIVSIILGFLLVVCAGVFYNLV